MLNYEVGRFRQFDIRDYLFRIRNSVQGILKYETLPTYLLFF